MQKTSFAGDLAGLPTLLPPFLSTNFEFSFSNDFLGRGGSVDDFRTQQLIATADLGERWLTVLDHSVLTLSDPAGSERIDQVSLSFGYRFAEISDQRSVRRLSAGFGLRSVGNYAGERMQNGFHRLIGSRIVDLPYSAMDNIDATAWIDAQAYSTLYESTNGWRMGYWLQARALATSGGQKDVALGLMGVASRGELDIWSGMRHDWRSGYDGAVQRATAHAEEDLAFVLGVRFGSIVLETVQQFNNEASFGQLRLLSLESAAVSRGADTSRLGIEFGFLLPDVHYHVAGRWRGQLAANSGSVWQKAVVLSADFGEPQYENDVTIFVASKQVSLGLEWERRISTNNNWLNAYGSLGAGWRREKATVEESPSNQTSDPVDRAVLAIGTGLRFYASSLGDHSHYRIQTGLTLWLPNSDATLTVGSTNLTLQKPAAALSISVLFEFG